MGEVYRAHDSRLGRDVAVKVISRTLSGDADRIKRFEQEARAAGALNHPNVVSIHDVGVHDGLLFVVMELLQGEPLRDRLALGPIPVTKAIDYSSQAAHGLAAAHAMGIVHRDLKPENLFITKDGRVKVLDFGLAKLTRPDILASSAGPTITVAATETGAILGTVGYMAPEQVKGHAVDHRSDLFALGAILYEMLTGKRAFRGASTVETLNAILTEEPPPLSSSGRDIPSGLEPVVRHCLEKSPEERFQSARDLAFDLEIATSRPGATTALDAAGRNGRRAFVALAVLLLLATPGLFLWGTRSARAPVPSFKRVTFRRGDIASARFTPDGQSVVYSARWEGRLGEVFSQRLASTDAREFSLAGARVEATTGAEMLVLLQAKARRGPRTLANVPLEGGTAREIIDSVTWADRSRDGSRLLVVRQMETGQVRLECPPGKVLLEGAALEVIDLPRFSPAGDQIAFLVRPNSTYTAGHIAMMDLSGRKRVLSTGWDGVSGLAWSPDGREVWFTASNGTSAGGELHAVTRSGKERLVMRQVSGLALEDIAPDGRVLLTYGQHRLEVRGRMAGDVAERDLSWLDGTFQPNLSPDGTRMIFQVSGDAGGGGNLIYLRRMDGSSPVRLGEGATDDVSPDWKWVLVEVGEKGRIELRLVPIGAGDTRRLPRGSIEDYEWARFHPDGKRIVIVGHEAGRPVRLFVQQVPDGLPRAFTPEGVRASNLVFSTDGRFVSARKPGPRTPYVLYPIEGGEPRAIPGLDVEDEPVVWSDHPTAIFVRKPVQRDVGSSITARVVRLDVQSGLARPWLEVKPPDPAGVPGIFDVLVTPNGRYYAYIYYRTLSDLYVVEGLR